MHKYTPIKSLLKNVGILASQFSFQPPVTPKVLKDWMTGKHRSFSRNTARWHRPTRTAHTTVFRSLSSHPSEVLVQLPRRPSVPIQGLLWESSSLPSVLTDSSGFSFHPCVPVPRYQCIGPSDTIDRIYHLCVGTMSDIHICHLIERAQIFMDFLKKCLYGSLTVTIKYNLGPSGAGCGWENLYATWNLILAWKDADSPQGWASAG